MSEVECELQRCRALYAELVLLSNLPSLGERQLLLAGFRALALDHLRSIFVLCADGSFGSAFALFRPLIETMVRGEWLAFCAEDKYCRAFMAGKYDRGCISFREMTRSLDQTLDIGPRYRIIESYFLSMADFTHTGHAAIIPRFEALSLERGSLPPHEVVQLLRQATRMTALHVCVALKGAHERETAERIASSLQALRSSPAASASATSWDQE